MSKAHREIATPTLIGDIGGTNARFAVVPDAEHPTIEFPVVQTKDFETLDAAIAETVLARSPVKPRSAIIAIAGPVDGDEIKLTNCPWVVRPRSMIAELGFSDVVVLNDFEAQALAVVALGSEHLEKIGGGDAEKDAAKLVLGPGTGLGVAGLIHSAGRWIPVPGEGGHMDLGPRSPRDFQVFPFIEKLDGRISGEQILCGRGLVNLYRAIAKADGIPPAYTQPSEITLAALSKSDPVAVEALSLFTTYLGRTAGDLALVFKSQGGVFLTGGIAQKIVPALQEGAFREAFDDKAPHRGWMSEIPIHVITHPLAALQGLGAYARNQAAFGVETEGRRWHATAP
ncbi:MAG: glucokinase [Rhizobiaceae bacterium]|nr:glucokinase [Rhizobiaceae bacterium]